MTVKAFCATISVPCMCAVDTYKDTFHFGHLNCSVVGLYNTKQWLSNGSIQTERHSPFTNGFSPLLMSEVFCSAWERTFQDVHEGNVYSLRKDRI